MSFLFFKDLKQQSSFNFIPSSHQVAKVLVESRVTVIILVFLQIMNRLTQRLNQPFYFSHLKLD